jgi:mRNA-degrading endonuclease RelE of RelBE toxin-antitoxin system
VPKRQVRFAPEAARQFREFSGAERSRLKEAIMASLGDDDAAKTTRNRFPLRRPSAYGAFELRVGDLRVFYRIVEDEVRVTVIGRKAGNQLFISGKRITL